MSVRPGREYAPVPVLASTLTEVSQFYWPRGGIGISIGVVLGYGAIAVRARAD